MELKVKVLCRPEVAPGFELAGVSVVRADEAHAAEALRALVEDAKVGVVVVEDRLHRVLPDDLLARLERKAIPAVVPFPTPSWDGPGVAEEYVLEMLRQAIGYRVRPR